MPDEFRGTRSVAAALLMALFAAACGGGSTAPKSISSSTGSRTKSVTVVNNAFRPSATTVPVGSTVTWIWNACVDNAYGSGCTTHNVTFDDGPASPSQSSGGFGRTFTEPGRYRYHCTLHGSAMSGVVTVQ